MGIDMFINQLILSGLADYSCLELISNHYLKLLEVYNIVKELNVSQNTNYKANLDRLNDILIVEVLDNDYSGDINSLINDDSYFSINIDRIDNNIIIIIENEKYESEEEIYETRFARHKEIDNSQWS